MATVQVRLLAGDAVLDENGALVEGTALGNIDLDLSQSNDEYPDSLVRQGEQFFKSYPGLGFVLAAYTRLEGKVNVSGAVLLPYSESNA